MRDIPDCPDAPQVGIMVSGCGTGRSLGQRASTSSAPTAAKFKADHQSAGEKRRETILAGHVHLGSGLCGRAGLVPANRRIARERMQERIRKVDRGVDEALDLNAVTLQLRSFDSTPDTKLNGLGELGGNHHIVLIFPSIQHVVAFHSKNVWQENRITRSDSCVLDSECQRSTAWIH